MVASDERLCPPPRCMFYTSCRKPRVAPKSCALCRRSADAEPVRTLRRHLVASVGHRDANCGTQHGARRAAHQGVDTVKDVDTVAGSLTLLRAHNGRRLAKQFTVATNGKIVRQDYDSATWFCAETVPLAGIRDLHLLLLRLEADRGTCVI